MYLKNIDHEFPIIALSESWIQDHTAQRYSINGYDVEHNYRPNRTGGGVSLFIKSGIEYKVRKDLCHQNKNIESLLIEIEKRVLIKFKI